MQLWLIPFLYAVASIVGSLIPRLEAWYFAYDLDLSISWIERSDFDPKDRAAARVEDRQGLGLSHRQED